MTEPKEESPPITPTETYTDQYFRRFKEALPGLTNQDHMSGLFNLAEELAKERTELEELAVYDTLLKKFFRHQKFLELLDEEVTAAETIPSGKPNSALIFLDLDNFKAVNDSFGHTVGDELLKTTGDAVLRSIRPGDPAGRVGGEELAVLVRRTTVEGAVAAARRIQAAVMRASQDHHPTLGITQTVSVGICMVTPNLTGEETLHAADAAMYVSKGNGKDRITIASVNPGQQIRMIPVEPLQYNPGK